MNYAVLACLRCPNCGSTLVTPGARGPLRCARGHSFDIARQGYATLTAGRTPHTGDSTEMIADRERFLAAGHYAFIAEALAAAAAQVAPGLTDDTRTAPALTDDGRTAAPGAWDPAAATTPGNAAPGPFDPGAAPWPLDAGAAPGPLDAGAAPGPFDPGATPGPFDPGAAAAAGTAGLGGPPALAAAEARLVVDAGTGTGYYLARVLDGLPAAVGLGLDVSKPALRRAARSHPRADAALADLWRPLPLTDGSAALILDVFAPRNGAEFHRVLHPTGALLVVTPAADHLAELIDAFGLIRVDPDKADRVSDSLDAHFTATATTTYRHPMRLNGDEVRTLIGMTPSARHVSPNAVLTGPGAGDAEPTAATEVTAAIHLTIYRPA
jgi:23S rRNA (guanine745-N1)-methyltransferase